jgi:DnaJ-class molecular chaperone
LKFKPEEKEKAPVKEPEWDEDTQLCPECEGRGFVKGELCLTCDGLGVVYNNEGW